MFERYTEKARRAIFFARYEASQFGSPEIESEHLLLGLTRERGAILSYILGVQNKEDEMRSRLEAASVRNKKTSTSVDLPLANECKRILAYAAEEAERLSHKHIGVEHLMLGILREENCLAARVLREFGGQLKKARAAIAEAPLDSTSEGPGRTINAVTAAHTAAHYKLVDAASSKTLLQRPVQAGIPCIGDAIVIRLTEGASQSYRVKDVVWEFEEFKGATISQEVSVFVVEEDSA